MSEEEYIYFTGDFFVSENDDVNTLPMIQRCFGNNPVIFNVEGVPALAKSSDNTRRKAVSLSLNQSILRLRSLQNCYFSLVNNHSSDCGHEAFKIFIGKLGDNVLYSSVNEVDPRRNVGPLSIIFFADEREECRCKDFGFLRFDHSVILKNRVFIQGSYIMIHGGLEYRKYPTLYQRYLSQLLVDLGACAVFFHHSHISGSHEWFKNKLIHYGLGNFYFSSVENLHGYDKVDGKVLRICPATSNYEVSNVVFSKSRTGDLNLDLTFSPLTGNVDLPPLTQYARWYREKYPLDGSFRPRQLYFSETIIRTQYFLWYSVASFLLKVGFTKKLKYALNQLLKK